MRRRHRASWADPSPDALCTLQTAIGKLWTNHSRRLNDAVSCQINKSQVKVKSVLLVSRAEAERRPSADPRDGARDIPSLKPNLVPWLIPLCIICLHQIVIDPAQSVDPDP